MPASSFFFFFHFRRSHLGIKFSISSILDEGGRLLMCSHSQLLSTWVVGQAPISGKRAVGGVGVEHERRKKFFRCKFQKLSLNLDGSANQQLNYDNKERSSFQIPQGFLGSRPEPLE